MRVCRADPVYNLQRSDGLPGSETGNSLQTVYRRRTGVGRERGKPGRPKFVGDPD